MMQNKIMVLGSFLLPFFLVQAGDSELSQAKTLGEALQVCIPEITSGRNLIEFSEDPTTLIRLTFDLKITSPACQHVLSPSSLASFPDGKHASFLILRTMKETFSVALVSLLP